VPHVIVKSHAGRTERQKAKLAEQVTQAVMAALKLGEESVSVAIEDVRPEDWVEQVYKPDILRNLTKIYKKPGYDPLG